MKSIKEIQQSDRVQAKGTMRTSLDSAQYYMATGDISMAIAELRSLETQCNRMIDMLRGAPG